MSHQSFEPGKLYICTRRGVGSSWYANEIILVDSPLRTSKENDGEYIWVKWQYAESVEWHSGQIWAAEFVNFRCLSKEEFLLHQFGKG